MHLQQGVSVRPFIRWFLLHPLCYRWWLSLYVRKHSHYTPCPFSLFLHPIPHCLPRRTDWMFALRSLFDHFKVQTSNCIPAAHFGFACACGTGVSVVRAAPGVRAGVMTKSDFSCVETRFFPGICHCTLVVQAQVPKLCTDLDLSLLYILILGTYRKFTRKINFL